MSLYRFAVIASVAVAVITVWQFIDYPDNETRTVSNGFRHARSTEDLSFEPAVYKGERIGLLAMYQAAVSLPYESSKNDALRKVVTSSILSKYFMLAIVAAKESPCPSAKAEMLNEIVTAALSSKETLGYAVLAADNMPNNSLKNAASERIILADERFSPQPF